MGRDTERSAADVLVLYYCWVSTLEVYLRYVLSICNVGSQAEVFGSEELQGLLADTMVACTCCSTLIPNVHKSFKVDRPIANAKWSTLSSLLGPGIMNHLISQMAIFMKLPFGNFLQINGRPLDKSFLLGDHTCKSSFQEAVDRYNPGVLKIPGERMTPKCRLDPECCLPKRSRTSSSSSVESESMLQDVVVVPKARASRGRGLGRSIGRRRLLKANRLGSTQNSAVDEEDAIRVTRLLYSTMPSMRSHIMHKVGASRKGAQLLAERIFLVPGELGCLGKLPQKMRRVFRLLHESLKRFEKLNIGRALETFCSLSPSVKTLLKAYRKQKRRRVAKRISISAPQRRRLFNVAASSFIDPYKVFLFIKHVCQKVFPAGLLGTKSNWLRLFRNIRPFFDLGKKEFVCVQQLTRGIKLSLCNWMFKSGIKPKGIQKPFHHWQEATMKKLVRWVAADFVVPLVRSCFYVTETGMEHDRVFFYRRISWAAIESTFMDSSFADIFEQVKKQRVLDAISRRAAFGYGKVRFIPKRSKVRPVAKFKWDDQKDKKELERVLAVFKFVRKQQPKLTGCAVLDIPEAHKQLLGFSGLRRSTGRVGSLYYFCSDIERCFDSMPQDKLLDAIANCLQDDDYQLKEFKALRQVSPGVVTAKTELAVTTGNALDPAPKFFTDNLLSGNICLKNSVIVDVNVRHKRSRRGILGLIRKHVMESFVRIGNRFYHQVSGVAQGSILSPFYCNFLYGQMEADLMKDLDSEQLLALRWVDDYLIISTDEGILKSFVERLYKKFSQYGIRMNMDRSTSNINATSMNYPARIRRAFGDWVGWCNLLVNIKTLDVKYNFECFIGSSIGETLTVRLDSRPGRRMLDRLSHHVRMRLIPIVIDPKLNSAETIQQALYSLSCLVAKKMDYGVGRLLKASHSKGNTVFWKRCIHRLFSVFYRHYGLVHQRTGSGSDVITPKKVVKKIYFAAFFHIMSKRKTRYRKLLKMLKRFMGPDDLKFESRELDLAL